VQWCNHCRSAHKRIGGARCYEKGSEVPNPHPGRLSPWLPVLLLIVVLIAVVALVRTSGSPVPTPQFAATTPSPAPTPTEISVPMSERPVAVFIGDSYAAGAGLKRGVARWTSVVSAAEGWREVNLGRAGTGYTARPPSETCGYARCPDFVRMAFRAVAEQPQVVVVAGGQNDTFLAYHDLASEQSAITATFQTLRAGLPDAIIVAVGPPPIWGVTSPLLDIESAVREAVETNGGVFVSLLSPSVINSSNLLPDGIHAGEEGHAEIASRVMAALDCWMAGGGADCATDASESGLFSPL